MVNENEGSGESAKQSRKPELDLALKSTILELEKLCKNNSFQIGFAIILNIVLIFVGFLLGKDIYQYDNFEEFWSWQIIYFTASKIICVSVMVSFIVYTLNLLRYYLHNYKTNRDKLFIARSMSGLIDASSDFIETSIVFNKLLDIIISDSSTTLVKGKEDEAKIESFMSLVELLKEALKIKQSS